MINLSRAVKVETCLPPIAAGSADRNGTIIDTQGFDGIAFVVHFGTIAAGAVTSIFVEHGSDSGLSDAATVVGSTQTVAATDDNEIFAVDISNPTKRYARVVINKDATNNTIESAAAYLYNGQDEPVTQPSDVNDTYLHAPA